MPSKTGVVGRNLAEVMTVVSVTSVNSLQASIAQSERLVQQDQSRVNQDASRLEQSQQQLVKDKEDLAQTQTQSRQAQQTAPAAAPAIRLDKAIQNPPVSQQKLPAELTQAKPQINARGETLGRLINITA